MCGINGILRLDPDAAPVDRAELERSRDAMAARGPDGQGLWLADDGEIGLGHQRLAIIDLSDAGLQPMSWGDGRYRMVYNGEIYNYAALREELIAEGVSFRSHCDAEVILALYAKQGTAALSRLRGMYAIALWDAREHSLLLARDPYGIKPLYLARSAGQLRFASQVKALEAGGAVDDAVDPAALTGFLLWGAVPGPRTIRKQVRALPPGHHLRVQRGAVGEPQPHYQFRPGARGAPGVSCGQALEDSVAAHLVSDVPVAVFLSAGLDSSLIAALARRQLGEPPTTLTLQFDEFAGTPRDEAPLAAEIARRLGTRHIERKVRREEFLDLWPRAIRAMDQPSIDGFNTFVVSEAARAEGYKVVLSGLGGDELMGGYGSFREVPSWARWTAGLRRVPGLGAAWPALASRLAPRTPKLAGLLEHGGDLPGAYFLRRALFLPSELPALIGRTAAAEGLAAYDPVADVERCLDAVEGDTARDAWLAVHVMESSLYMHNQLLRDSDWASMAHSLELRVPLVDAALREQLAARDFQPARRAGKAAMVREAAPELPESLWTRPKTGFSIPVMEWLDEEIGLDATPGALSRLLALRVLEAFDVPVEGSAGAARRAS